MSESDSVILGKLETLKHIHKVRAYLYQMIEELDNRARLHDQSKLDSPEKETFGEYTPELAKTEYGTPEYEALLEKVRPAIEHHYANNRHHPEWAICNEEWRPIIGYEGYYEVSNLGRAKSVSRVINRESTGNITKIGAIRKVHWTPKGYYRIQLVKEKESKNHQVHRLVGEAFVPNPDNKPFINHKNSIRTDNRVENLEWVTPSENLIHAYDFGFKEPNLKYIVKCTTCGKQFTRSSLDTTLKEHKNRNGYPCYGRYGQYVGTKYA